VYELARRGEFAVLHPCSSAHALHIARPDGRAIAHRIAVCELTGKHVADDLHVSVPVGAESGSRGPRDPR
jgi:hypothetical protein